MSTVAEEENTKESFIRATAGRHNLHHATQKMVPNKLEELETLLTQRFVFCRRSHDSHLQKTLRKDEIQDGTSQCLATN